MTGCLHLINDPTFMYIPTLVFRFTGSDPSIVFSLPYVERDASFAEQDVDIEIGVSHSVLRRGLHGQGGDGAGTLSFPDPDYITRSMKLGKSRNEVLTKIIDRCLEMPTR